MENPRTASERSEMRWVGLLAVVIFMIFFTWCYLATMYKWAELAEKKAAFEKGYEEVPAENWAHLKYWRLRK